MGRAGNRIIASSLEQKGTLRLKPLTLFEDEEGKLTTVPPGNRITAKAVSKCNCAIFGAAIRGQTPAMNNAEQAVELMEMIDGIYASSELGREVPVA